MLDNLRLPIAISLGAIAGALSRYYLTLWFTKTFGTSFPYGTLTINLTGCLAMGFFSTLVVERISPIPPEVQLLVATGFLGAYTTFSTYGMESVNLWRGGAYNLAGIYWAGSAILGIVSVQAGIILARLLK